MSNILPSLNNVESKISSIISELRRIKRDPEDAANAERYAKKAISELEQLKTDIRTIKNRL